MYRFLILVLSLVPISACSDRYVGGRCEYETLLGVARLSGTTGGEKQFMFYPADPVSAHEKVAIPRDLDFTARQSTDVVSNAIRLPAQLSVITEGSCTPYNFMLLSSEYFSHNVFIPFNQHGRISDTQEQRFIELGRIYRTLKNDWPELSIGLCEDMQATGTDRYNKKSVYHYSDQVKSKLLSYNFDPDKIHTVSAKNACGGVLYFDTNGGNGVNIRFVLTKHLKSIGRDPAAVQNGGNRP